MRKLFLQAKAEDLAFEVNTDFCCFKENQVFIIVHLYLEILSKKLKCPKMLNNNLICDFNLCLLQFTKFLSFFYFCFNSSKPTMKRESLK